MTRARLAVAALATLLAAAAVAAAEEAPVFSLAGDSPARVALGVAAGLAVVAAGLALEAGGSRAGGRLLAAGGCAWLAAGLATPGAPGVVAFTAGLVLVAAAPALIGHALLALTGGGRPAAALAASLYVALAGLLGLLPALAFDPATAGCPSCPANLLQVADEPGAAADLSRWGVRLGLAAVAATFAYVLWCLARSPAARRLRAAPPVLPGCAYLALAGASLAHAWQRGFLGTDPTDQALWAAQAAALLALATGVAVVRIAARRRRARMARLVVELGEVQRPGGLREALAGVLGDPHLDLLYASPGGWIDLSGHAREATPGMGATELVRDGEPVALLCHRPGLLDDMRLADEIERCVRLGLEHERLEGELRRQLDHLRRSRADVAAAGEAERRLLERDLHDGAQQRLVALAFALGIARRHARPEQAPALETAQAEVQAALEELREVAHGLYPVALAEAGLAAAIESLRDRRPGLRVGEVPPERFPPAVEETAYLAIAGLADHWSPQPVGLSAARSGGTLAIELSAAGGPPPDMVGIEDRVGALGGSVAVRQRPPGSTEVRVELPCG